MRLLGEENQVVPCSATRRKPSRERNVDGLLPVIPKRSHARQRASDGDMLELPSTVFAAKDIRAVRIVSKHGDNIERLCGLSGH